VTIIAVAITFVATRSGKPVDLAGTPKAGDLAGTPEAGVYLGSWLARGLLAAGGTACGIKVFVA